MEGKRKLTHTFNLWVWVFSPLRASLSPDDDSTSPGVTTSQSERGHLLLSRNSPSSPSSCTGLASPSSLLESLTS